MQVSNLRLGVIRNGTIFSRQSNTEVLDGYEISSFNRHKHEYSIDAVDYRGAIDDALRDFEKYLHDLEVALMEVKIQDYCLRYSLETPDALHVLAAIQNSSYLVTTDTNLKGSGITEVSVIDPDTLVATKELCNK
jgi:predicted nucleic acid-binding protein